MTAARVAAPPDVGPLPAPRAEPAQGESCATPPAAPSLAADDAARLAGVLRALGDPSRLRMVAAVAHPGVVCVCDLAAVVDVSQPTVSHHLRVLRDAGVLAADRRGTWVHYRLRPEAEPLVRALLTAPTPDPPSDTLEDR